MPGPRLSTIDVKPSSQWPLRARWITSPLGGRCTRSGNVGLPVGTTRQSTGEPVAPRSRTSVASAAIDLTSPPSLNAMRDPAGDQTGLVPGGPISCAVPLSTTIVPSALYTRNLPSGDQARSVTDVNVVGWALNGRPSMVTVLPSTT